jgi:hypothetical protein
MPLAEMQRDFAQAVLTCDAPALVFAPGAVSAEAALRVHRNTVMGALTGALRLAYPAVDALVGETFFDQAAAAFAQTHPPASARLTGYGEDFTDFLQLYPSGLAYLADVARLDWAIDRVLSAPAADKNFALDAAVSLALPQSLTVLRLDYAADVIKSALAANDDAALAAIDLAPAPRWILVWRRDYAAAVRDVSAPAGIFLQALLADADAQAAFAAAQSESDTALQSIQTDIFSASFCTVISNLGDVT